MKKSFAASLCYKGILGGGLYLSEDALNFKTNKITVDAAIRNIRMPLSEIEGLSAGRLLIVPTMTLRLRSGKEYRFIVFARKRFLEALRESGLSVGNI